MARSSLLVAAALLGACSALQVGDRVPNAVLDYGFPPEKVDLGARIAGKKVILVGLPGAFTPTWSTRQVPGYLEEADSLKHGLGIDEVIIFCVNDGAVMAAWAEDQKVDKSDLITLMGDPTGTFTDAVDMHLRHPGPEGKGLIGRSKRFAAYVVDGIVKVLRVSESGPMGQEDPAGDDFPEETLAPAMIQAIQALGTKSEL